MGQWGSVPGARCHSRWAAQRGKVRPSPPSRPRSSAWLLHTPDSWLRAIVADLFQGLPDDNWSAVGFDPVALWVVRQADGSLRISVRPGEGGEGFFDYRLTMKL